MKLFESRKEKFFKNITLLFPLFLLLCVGLVFFIAIGQTSDTTIQKEQSALAADAGKWCGSYLRTERAVSGKSGRTSE